MSTKLNNAMQEAVENGHLDEVKRLLEAGADSKSNDSSALQAAAMNGHLEIVKLLLPVSNPKAAGSHALYLAARNGHLEIVKLLLPVSDPRTDSSWALQSAAENGHQEIVRLLFPHSNYIKVLENTVTTASRTCDLLLSCLSPDFVKEFIAANPNANLPRSHATRSHAMLGAGSLRQRSATSVSAATPRKRA